jgi:glycosyltransferase involved in cell wall biosynthesis
MPLRARNRRFRVLFVATGYPTPEYPNQSIFTHRSIKELSRFVDPLVIHLRAWRPGRPLVEKREWENVAVVSVSCPQGPLGSASHLNSKLLAWFGAFSVRRYLNVVDLIHATDIYPSGFVASQWGRASKKPHTTHVIGSDVNLFLPANLPNIGKEWLSGFGGFVCNSTAIMQRLSDLVPGLQSMNVIHRGVDTDFFTPDGILSGPQSILLPVRFLFLGGFHTWDPNSTFYNIKGGHNLLDAWQQVEGQISPSSLYIGGPGADMARLEKWRAGLQRPNAVFLSGPIPPVEIPALLRTCDVVVIPSLSEGLPNVANEAQSCGCAVLGTDAGGIPESVVHGETGRIVPRGDAGAMAGGLEWFHLNQPSISTMGHNGRLRMIKNFSWEKFANKMLTFFQDVLN